MKSVIEQIANRVADAFSKLGVTGDPMVRLSQDERFGDYQSNAAMGLAKQLGKPPRAVAESILTVIRIDDICEPPTIAGPGFINFRLKPGFLSHSLTSLLAALTDGDRLGIGPTDRPRTVVVDLCSPNLAKEMHVGHLRSTVIGDCVARVLEFQGHRVIRENHVGDWGTQFGMLVAYLKAVHPDVVERPDGLVISDLESFYVAAKQRFDTDEEFKKEARDTVVALQRGEPTTRKIWKAFCDESLRHCHAICDRLGVRLVDRGESVYTDLMDEVVRRLEGMMNSRRDGLIAVSEGALCVFPDGFKTREGEPLPLIARKTDGAYNYATSDLATIIHRVETLHADRIIYVVGLSQKQHFEMLFAAALAVGFVDAQVGLEHLGFGNVLSATGKPFKTREGGTVKLKDLLDEAVERARSVIERQTTEEPEVADGDEVLTAAERKTHSEIRAATGGTRARSGRVFSREQAMRIAETVGIGAVKYFDLAHSLQSDYKFDLDTILAMDGNTAPYMLYAYARIRSIGRKASVDFSQLATNQPILIEHPSEIALAKKLVQFGTVVESVGRDLRPNVLTDYLYDLSRSFSRFYDKKLGVRVIDASPEAVRLSRLRLCDLTARALKLGLNLLGIDTLEEM